MDRNNVQPRKTEVPGVALRKESVDRNSKRFSNALKHLRSLSARRAWIEISGVDFSEDWLDVALRKESVDRNGFAFLQVCIVTVALRKESVDRNHRRDR